MTNRLVRVAFACAAAAALASCFNATTQAGPDAAAVCRPSCLGRACGDDGCGGTCGPGCLAGERCEPATGTCHCAPSCDGRVCGPDGCGGTCAPGCAADQDCGPGGACQAKICVPSCAGKDCGLDGCGGTCGTNRGGCPLGEACTTSQRCGACKAACATGQECGQDSSGCSCGTCPAGKSCGTGGKCGACTPSCAGKTCGDDGCGGTCAPGCVPGQGCTREGVCVGCLPGPECAGAQCGFDSLGCACGSCGAGLFCQRDRTCAVCPDTLGSVTIDTFCQTIEHGLKRWSAWNYQSCGMVIDDADPGKLHLADIDHLDAEYGTATDGAQIGLPPYYPVGPYDELMTCSADLASPFNALKTAVAAGHVCFDSRAVDDCMNAAATLKQAGSYGSMEPLGRTPLPASCSKFFYPHQKKGEPCANQWECVEGLYCKASDSGLAACTGVCAPPLTVGRPCTERDVCQKKSACKQASTGAPYECVALIPSGQACNPNADDPGCEEDLYCSPSKKKCTAYGALGDPCEAIDSYGTPSCTGDLQCVSPATGGAKVCTTPPKPLGVGRVCAADSECRDCLWCKGADSSTGTTGLCRPLAKIGDACNPADANPCPAVAPLVLECAAAKQQCRLMPREGATCFVDPNGTDSQGNPIDMDATQWGDCLYLDDFCKRTTNGPSGVCSAPPKLGEPCGNTFSSASWCQGTAWCKATGATSVCSAPEPDGTSCDVAAASPSAACASGYCLVLADGTGRCGVPPGVGSPCGRVAGDSSPSLCGAGAYCAVTQAATDAGPAVYQCLAIKAGADACTSSSQCATGLCGYDGKCALDCMSPPGTDTSGCGAYNGFNWFAKYIFAAGTLLFLGRRRRKKSP